MRIIRGRKAIVTGAGSGIGRAIALALAAEGADLFLIDIDANALAGVAREAAGCNVEVIIAACDLAVPAATTKTIDRVRSLWSDVHILVNCAGVACYGLFHATTEEVWRRTMAVNLMAPMQIVHELIDVLLRVEEAHIVNVCSYMGLVPATRVPVYQASKFGLVGFSLALRNDYHRENFGVTALCPGFVRTQMLDKLSDPEGIREPAPPGVIVTNAEKVAASAIAAIRHNRGLVVLTPFARIAWWLMRLSPAFTCWLLREGWRKRGRIAPPPRPERAPLGR
jgi:3-oxoacyl-[acyl-carrier protein] reductase